MYLEEYKPEWKRAKPSSQSDRWSEEESGRSTFMPGFKYYVLYDLAFCCLVIGLTYLLEYPINLINLFSGLIY